MILISFYPWSLNEVLLRSGFFFLIMISLFLGACGSTPSSSPMPTLPPTPTIDPYFQSIGGGDPRTPGYWLLWNTCMPDNNAETASANGGREAGWYVLDDFLLDPGIKLGGLVVETCLQAVQLLQMQDSIGVEHKDLTDFRLASALLAAELNLSSKAASCPAVVDAVLGSMRFLNDIGFDGQQTDLMANADEKQSADAILFITALEQYNQGDLCR